MPVIIKAKSMDSPSNLKERFMPMLGIHERWLTEKFPFFITGRLIRKNRNKEIGKREKIIGIDFFTNLPNRGSMAEKTKPDRTAMIIDAGIIS
jgi:hypothetical protein